MRYPYVLQHIMRHQREHQDNEVRRNQPELCFEDDFEAIERNRLLNPQQRRAYDSIELYIQQRQRI